MAGLDLTGQLFGRLTVLGRADRDARHRWRWRCVCLCTKVSAVRSDNLTRGHIVSCGCFCAEKSRARMTTHGLSYSPEYVSWRAMITRCLNPNHPHYADYGGRGILICPEWMASFEAFYRDMGPRPEPKKLYSLDRVNPNGHYDKENCRWATPAQQAETKRPRGAATGVTETHEGPQELTADEWAEQGW